MKLTLEPKNLVEAIGWATKGYDQKNEKAFVLLSVNADGTAYLVHTSDEAYALAPLAVDEVKFSSDEDDEALVALDGRYLQRLAGVLNSSGESITLSRKMSKKLGPLSVKDSSGAISFSVPVLRVTPADAPTLVKVGEVDEAEYFDALQRLARICDSVASSSGAATTSVSIAFDVEDEKVKMMATNVYALGEIIVDFDAEEEGVKAISEALDEAIVLLPQSSALSIGAPKTPGAVVELMYDPAARKFGYAFADGRKALFSLDSSEPIIYEALKDMGIQSAVESVTLSSTALQKAVSVVSSLAWDEVDVKLVLTKDKLIVADEHHSNKVAVEVSESDFDGELEVTFNRANIKAGFSPVATEYVRIGFSGAEDSFRLEPIAPDGTAVDNVFVMVVPSVV